MPPIRVRVMAPPLWHNLLELFVSQCPRLVLEDASPAVLLLAGPDWKERLQQVPDPQRRKSTAVLVTDGDCTHLRHACTLGIRAFISAADTASDLEAAINAAARGRSFCPPQLIMHWMEDSGHGFESPGTDAWTLSEQQLHVIQLAAQGLTNAEIAERVHLSPNTVKYHLKYAYRRLGATRRCELRQLLPPSPATGATRFR